MVLPLQIRFLMIYHEPKQVTHSKRLKKKGFLSREFSSREHNKKLANGEVLLHILCQRCWLLYSKLPIKKFVSPLQKTCSKNFNNIGDLLSTQNKNDGHCKTYIIYQNYLSLNYQTKFVEYQILFLQWWKNIGVEPMIKKQWFIV